MNADKKSEFAFICVHLCSSGFLFLLRDEPARFVATFATRVIAKQSRDIRHSICLAVSTMSAARMSMPFAWPTLPSMILPAAQRPIDFVKAVAESRAADGDLVCAVAVEDRLHARSIQIRYILGFLGDVDHRAGIVPATEQKHPGIELPKFSERAVDGEGIGLFMIGENLPRHGPIALTACVHCKLRCACGRRRTLR